MTPGEAEPTDPDWTRLLEGLRESGYSISLVVTGGGSGAVARCFRRAGASKNFVEGVVPYSRAATEAFLGGLYLESSASPAAAQQLAAVAMERAAKLADDKTENSSVAGVALTAALPTHPPRRGVDRIHVALCTARSQVLWSTTLESGQHTRESAESIADQMVYLALAELCEQALAVPQALLEPAIGLVRQDG